MPSEVLHKGDSFDLMVFDVSMSYQSWQSKKNNKEDVTKMYDQDQLQSIMNRTKEKYGKDKG